MQLLKNKKILLGVTGSIAAYKALELIRLFTKAGAEVRVIMSGEAERFIGKISFEALSKNAVLDADSESWHNDQNHIFINKWADIFLIAPTTANTINKLSCGIADNLLLSTALAFTKPLVIAPAANTAMFLHPATQASIQKLKSFGAHIIEAQEKLLACDDKGSGALAEVKNIFFQTARVLLKTPFWDGKEAIVTGGGTIEKIDDVRFISNFSSGKMAENLCLCLYLKGANVTFIQSCAALESDLGIRRVYVQSAQDMQSALDKALSNKKTDFLFMTAAVSDYKPSNPQKGKLKKELLGENFELKLTKTTDILANLDKKGAKVVGFKAELDRQNAEISAQKMLKNKNLNAVCLNVIEPSNPFGGDENEIIFFTDKEPVKLTKKPKLEIAFEILKLCEEL